MKRHFRAITQEVLVMRKKLGLIAIIALLSISLSGLAVAANSIQLIVNGTMIKPDVPPEIKNGRTMVPIRWVAEAFGADVRWNSKQQTVTIDTPEPDLRQQIALLQQGYSADTPQEAAQTWAKAVKQRNGAVQFALLSADSKKKTESHYKQIHWVTGVSSPYVDQFDITKEQKINDRTWKFDIEFQLKTSTGSAGSEFAALTVAQIDGNWFITKISGDVMGVPELK